ncbi:hypothetical protein Daus18300_000611 [Diaporthe australafricana]|uniref:Benzoate 4-monooxygenase cytochrome P450 n=1 Tax=Diaporthe australafricana TaxID=127596 RepID=A0ABR3Y581_9PEZI
MDENDSTEWSAATDFSRRLDSLTFDIMGDLAFGRSFDIKEPGKNPLKAVPENIAGYMKFYYPLCRSPFLDFLIWIKPRGLDWLFGIIAPQSVRDFNRFTDETLAERKALHAQQAEKPEGERRQDIFYFIREARDPDTGLPAYNDMDLKSESSLMIIAGSDTTSISLSGVFFCLTGDPTRCQKLVDEIRATFDTPEDIVYGPKLLNCKYLRACIDEGMRFAPSGPCDLPREVLKGGIRIDGNYYPEGTIVATVPWALTHDKSLYGDPEVYRPERWIEDSSAGVSKESVARLKQNFHPFAAGPGACLGRHVAMAEMLLTVARTLHRLDIRRLPGSTFGGGRPSLGWGESDPRQITLYDAFISLRDGPEVQFRKRR